nr:hypothetical protein GCM10025730_04630 [Promicromonospora thailandica]
MRVLEPQVDQLRPHDLRRLLRLPLPRHRVTTHRAARHRQDHQPVPAGGVRRKRPAHADLDVVRVGTDRQHRPAARRGPAVAAAAQERGGPLDQQVDVDGLDQEVVDVAAQGAHGVVHPVVRGQDDDGHAHGQAVHLGQDLQARPAGQLHVDDHEVELRVLQGRQGAVRVRGQDDVDPRVLGQDRARELARVRVVLHHQRGPGVGRPAGPVVGHASSSTQGATRPLGRALPGLHLRR